MSIKILLCDDHQIVRQGLRALLDRNPDMEVIGEAGDGRSVLRMTEELSPDVIVIDVSMPNLNGIEATRQITSRDPKVKVIALSVYSDKRFIFGMIKAGALGYLVKDCVFDELIEAIRAVSINRTYLSSSIIDIVIKDYINRLRKDELSVFSILTAREREVLQLIAEGKTMKEIAPLLNLSVKTVETHRQQIMSRLNIHTVAELTKYAVREGLTSL